MNMIVHLKDLTTISVTGDVLDVIHSPTDMKMILVQNGGNTLYWIPIENFEYSQLA